MICAGRHCSGIRNYFVDTYLFFTDHETFYCFYYPLPLKFPSLMVVAKKKVFSINFQTIVSIQPMKTLFSAKKKKKTHRLLLIRKKVSVSHYCLNKNCPIRFLIRPHADQYQHCIIV